MPGVSDILGCLPGGRLLAVECKGPGNCPTRAQLAFLDAVANAGGLAVVVYDIWDLEAALDATGSGLATGKAVP
jgi:hypothetical protein